MQVPRSTGLLLRARTFLFSRNGVVALAVFAALTLALAAAILPLTETRIAYDPEDPAYNSDYWMQQIEKKGAKAAYEEFKQVAATAPEARTHLSAHVIGGLIGDTLGPDGITVCDPSFGFGCYHGFFGQVISTGGISLVKELDAACVQAYGRWGTGCQHGIGHGILEYVGYTRLAQALEICKETSQPTPLLGCTSGVFMEYNFPLAEGQSTTQRQFDPAKPHAPCDTVAEEFKDSCYVELGQWYRIMFGEDAATLGSLCSALPERERTHCFLGIGSGLGSFSRYDVTQAITLCKEFSAEDEFRCRAGVWWSFYQVPEERAKGGPACAYPDEADAERCRSLGDFTGGMAAAG